MCHKKIAVLLSIIILLGMCVVPGISNTIYKNKTKDDEFIVEAVDIFSHINTGNSSYANANWWPMFRHDTFHTGYSTGDAPNTGILKWHYITEGNIESSPSVANDKLYISSNDFYIYCLDIWDGDKIWQYKTGQDVFSSPAVVNGMVYVGSNDQKVYCLDAEQGNFIWSFSTGGEVRASPAIVDGNVYVGSRDGYIYCLDKETGSKIWSYQTDDQIYSSSAFYNGKVYVGSKDGKVYCLDAEQGDAIWTYQTSDYVTSSPAIADGKVYVGSWDNKVYCLDAETGNKMWVYITGGNVVSSPALASGMVYIGSRDDNVYCLDAKNGTQIWSFEADGSIRSSPAVADGKVYFSSWDNKVYCLDAAEGYKIWSYKTNAPVISSPAIAYGQIYVGSWDNNVYCLGEENKAPCANFTYAPLFPYSLEIIFFNDTSYDQDGYIASRHWDFGDGNTSSEQNMTHYYKDNGIYVVSLTVTDNDNTSETIIHNITIENLPPVAVNDAAITSVNTSIDIDVTENDHDEDGTIDVTSVNVSIDSTNGNTSVNHSTGSINYVPNLGFSGDDFIVYAVMDDDGSISNDAIVNITVTAIVPPNAAFTFSPSDPTTADAIEFIDESTDDGTIVSWLWDFGDSDTSATQNPIHSYGNDGIYIVNLTVTDDDNATDSVEKNVTVANIPPMAVNDSTSTLKDISVDIEILNNDYDTDGSINVSTVDIVSDVHNGSSSIESGVVIYSPDSNFVGNDDFSYTVMDDDGDVSNIAIVNITVVNSEPPIAKFSYVPNSPSTTSNVEFTDESTDDGTIVSWLWDFGDHNTSTKKNPTHKYATSGTYGVKLRVTDNHDLTDVTRKKITVVSESSSLTVKIIHPLQNDMVNGTINISGTAASDNPIQKVEIRIGSDSWYAAEGTKSWKYQWDTTTVDNGDYTIYARCYDGERYSDVASVDVTVSNYVISENEKPHVTISFPKKDSILSGNVEVRGTSFDSDGVIQKVEIKINDGSWILANGTTLWRYQWNITMIADGNHSINARSFDGEDYSLEDIVMVAVQNIQETDDGETGDNISPEKKDSSASSITLFIVIMLIACIAGAIPIAYIIKI